MSFRVNNVNYSCAPMYNQNNNNNVMGYLCSSGSRNYENFGTGPYSNDPTKSSNFQKPNYNSHSDGQDHNLDASTYYYLLSNPTTMTNSTRNESRSSFTFKVGNATMVNTILDFLVSSQNCYDNRKGPYTGAGSLVMIFQLYSDARGQPYYLLNPSVKVDGNGTMVLDGDNDENVTFGFGSARLTEMRNAGGNWQIRVGAVDQNQNFRQLRAN